VAEAPALTRRSLGKRHTPKGRRAAPSVSNPAASARYTRAYSMNSRYFPSGGNSSRMSFQTRFALPSEP